MKVTVSTIIVLLGVVIASSCALAEENETGGNGEQVSPPVNTPRTLFGLKLGVGLALNFALGEEEVLEASVDPNNIVRVTREGGREPRMVLESHYFFGMPTHNDLPFLLRWLAWLGCGTSNVCGHGPFIAIEPGSDGEPIAAYGLGYMLGFKRKGEGEGGDSWNIGLGYVADPRVQRLGQGLSANAPLPENDSIRFREESRAGVMILTSFSF